MMFYKVTYHDGDSVSSRINATEKEIRELIPIGEWRNVGEGANDCYKQIVRVDVSAIRDTSPTAPRPL